MIRSGRKVSRQVGEHIMTADAESRHAVMERIEAGRFELSQTIRNDPAAVRERALEPAAQLQVDAVQQQMMGRKLIASEASPSRLTPAAAYTPR